MSETNSLQEQYTGIIDLEDDDPIIVEIMLKYFYTGTYFEPVIKNDPANRRIEVSRSSLQNQVLTYILADKYDAQHLMSLLGQRLRSTLDRGSTPEEFLAIVPNVYTIPTPANPLRIIAAEHARANLEDLMQKADGEILRATLKKVPEFAFDVLRLVAGAPLIGHCHTCGPHQSAESIQARCRKCGKGGMSLSRG